MSLIPVTILTGFLGSGKTTLLNRILRDSHGQRIAVIENEFGEAGIDSELLVQDDDQQIVEMNNGCICCTVRGDLVRILGKLADQRQRGLVRFDRVIIETTGLADPAPVVQVFFTGNDIGRSYVLDAIVTLVDAKHAMAQLDNHDEAQKQIGFADRLLISKCELVTPAELTTLRQRLVQMNPRAPIKSASFGGVAPQELLDIRGFDLAAILEIEPDGLADLNSEHVDHVSSFVFRSKQPFQMERLEGFLHAILQVYGPQMMRYKGLLWIAGAEERVVLQGVHMLLDTALGARWKESEERESCLVFIGDNLPKDLILDGLAQCLLLTVASADDTR
jgi:G3E family GTPase